MQRQEWHDKETHQPKRTAINKEEAEARLSFLAKLINKQSIGLDDAGHPDLNDLKNALEIEMMMKPGRTKDEIDNRLNEMGYGQINGEPKKIQPIDMPPDKTLTPLSVSIEVPKNPGKPEDDFSPKKELNFSDFNIQTPEVPDKDEEFVSLIDEESSTINIYNLTLGECKEIIGALDSVIAEAVKTKTNQSLKFRGKTRSINFSIIYIPEDNREIISVTGRDVENEDDKGSYCHDFEIDGMTIEDWEKLKSLIQK